MSAILFLDVDGVLNCLNTWGSCDDMIDPDCCARLLNLLERTQARVVLSSSWRGMAPLEKRLERAGVMAHVIGRTPHKRTNDQVRGHEIELWMRSHPAELGEGGRYAIVDDDADMLPEQMARFVQTSFHHGGLQDVHCERLEILLST